MDMTSDARLAQLVCSSASKINDICLQWHAKFLDLSASITQLGTNDYVKTCSDASRLYRIVRQRYLVGSMNFEYLWRSLFGLDPEFLQAHMLLQNSLFELAAYLLTALYQRAALPGHILALRRYDNRFWTVR